MQIPRHETGCLLKPNPRDQFKAREAGNRAFAVRFRTAKIYARALPAPQDSSFCRRDPTALLRGIQTGDFVPVPIATERLKESEASNAFKESRWRGAMMPALQPPSILRRHRLLWACVALWAALPSYAQIPDIGARIREAEEARKRIEAITAAQKAAP